LDDLPIVSTLEFGTKMEPSGSPQKNWLAKRLAKSLAKLLILHHEKPDAAWIDRPDNRN
jgi:hypothetical protein